MGGMKALDYEYGRNKPIEFNETDYFPLWYKGDKVGDSRVEAWEFMVGGGASFNHLNGIFTVKNPAGKTPENERVLRALAELFSPQFDFFFALAVLNTTVDVIGAEVISECGRVACEVEIVFPRGLYAVAVG